MTFSFRPAVREQIRLLIALSGGTGSGKTWTALLLAKGLAAGKRFAVIDTENGRASMYADFFDFDVVDLTAPFTSERYQEAILAAEATGYTVIVVDSGSHEYEGDGGILDRQESELAEMVKESKKRGDNREDWKLEDAHNMRAWNEAKQPHKKLMTKLLQLRAHVIFCLRAEDKIEIIKKEGKTVIQPKTSLTGLDGWIPICEKRMPFEFTASFLLMAGKPGYPRPIKLQEQHKAFFPLDKPITEEAGRLLGEWAKGGKPKMPPINSQPAPKAEVTEVKPGVYEPKPELIAKKWFTRIEQSPTVEMLKEIGVLLKDAPIDDDAKAVARELYAARMKQLKNGAANHTAPVSPSTATASITPAGVSQEVPAAVETVEEPFI